MATAIKFCGLTRAEDAAIAARLGATFAGVVFAGGPRVQTAESAAAVLSLLPSTVRRVGVMGSQTPAEMLRLASIASLDVIQLHGAADAAIVARLREGFGGEVWTVLKLQESILPPDFPKLVEEADGVLLDSRVDGMLGGTGRTLDWQVLAEQLRCDPGLLSGRRARLILAGGLRPENVGRAVSILRPDVVDVSSGVEGAVGRKDAQMMTDFVTAVHTAGGDGDEQHN